MLVASPEDVAVSKLRWFRRGGEVPEKQWDDVLGVLRVQRGMLDVGYMERPAGEDGVRDQLDRASIEAEGEEQLGSMVCRSRRHAAKHAEPAYVRNAREPACRIPRRRYGSAPESSPNPENPVHSPYFAAFLRACSSWYFRADFCHFSR